MEKRTQGVSFDPKRAQWRVRSKVSGKLKHLGYFATEQQAIDHLNAVQWVLASKPMVEAGGRTFRDVGEAWLSWRERTNPNGIRSERSRWRQIQDAPFMDLHVGDIPRPMIAAFVNSLPGRSCGKGRGRSGDGTERISQGSAKHYRTLLSGVFEYARNRLGMDIENPAKGFQLKAEEFVQPMAGDDDDPDVHLWTFLDEGELTLLHKLTASNDTGARAAGMRFLFLAYTGLRRGEAWALRWTDLVLDGPIPGCWARRSNKRSTTKSGKARWVPFTPLALAIARLWWAERHRPVKGPVFPTRTGGQRRADCDGGWLDKPYRSRRGELRVRLGWRTKAGITRQVRVHDLRHTCASHLIMGTWGHAWDLEQVRDLLGHTDVRVTRRYAHLSREHLNGVARQTTTAALSEGTKALESGLNVPVAQQVAQAALLKKASECVEIPKPPVSQGNHWRAIRDSNTGPLAPEANGSPLDFSDLGDACAIGAPQSELLDAERERLAQHIAQCCRDLLEGVASGQVVYWEDALALATTALRLEWALPQTLALLSQSVPVVRGTVELCEALGSEVRGLSAQRKQDLDEFHRLRRRLRRA